jgi:ATP-binding cassette, subfamily B, bacterial MsbA
MSGSKSKNLLADPGAMGLVKRLLWEQAVRQWPRYLYAFFLMLITAGATAYGAYLIRDIINSAYVDHNLQGIIFYGIVTAVIFMVKAITSYLGSVQTARIGNRIIAENQRRMFRRIIRQNIGFFAERHSSDFLARVTTGANAASQVLNLIFSALGRDLFLLIGLVAVMFWQDPVMSLFSFVVVPPAFVMLRKLIRRIYSIAKNQFTGGTRILETMQETVQGIRIVKAFTLETVMRERLEADVAALEQESNKWARVANRASPLMEALGGFAIAGALIYGGYRVLETGATPGQFFSFLAAFMLAYEPAKRLARLNIDLNTALVGVRILFDIIDTPPTEPREDGRPPLVLTTARVEFSNVQFAYRPGEPVIRGLSFVAEPGKVTALVGPSGGGKSTVLNLIMRFYEVSGGEVTIDGQNISNVARNSLRKQIAYVGQDVFLFHGSIRDNIALGKPGATEAEIVAAAKAAHAHEFITAIPLGYNAPVGERGTQISGGERQRIAIARALIRNAPIILLDEATASLDSESERLVQDAIAHLCQGRTTIVIAHRLHTITHADCILVIENGKIAESGRHDELLRKGGRYSAFYRLQIQQQEPSDVALAPSK